MRQKLYPQVAKKKCRFGYVFPLRAAKLLGAPPPQNFFPSIFRKFFYAGRKVLPLRIRKCGAQHSQGSNFFPGGENVKKIWSLGISKRAKLLWDLRRRGRENRTQEASGYLFALGSFFPNPTPKKVIGGQSRKFENGRPSSAPPGENPKPFRADRHPFDAPSSGER
jgi:hypothetical protein